MSDYEHMTDDELRRLIAERLGYTEVVEPKGVHVPGALFGRRGEGNYNWEAIPHWPQDCNAALMLFQKSGGEELTISFMDMEIVSDWHIYKDDERFKARIQQEDTYYDEPIARAICICWLLFQDSQILRVGQETCLPEK